MPKVSVIIPSFNYAQYLPECIASILSQTYSDFDVIIVNDGSTDNTEEVAQKLVSQSSGKVRYFKTENRGVTHARNFGIEKSNAEYVLPLDADDILTVDALAGFVSCIESDPKIGFAYSALENFGLQNDVWQPGEFQQERLIWENLAACTSLWRKEFFNRGIKYRDVIFEDWDLWLQIAAAGYSGKYIPKILFKYRIHQTGRNTINKNRYMQSLIQEVSLNPSLYNPGLLGWSQSALKNFPECLNKPTVVFLPRPGSAEYTEFDGDLAKVACNYVERGYFAVALGDYRSTSALPLGVVLLTLRPGNIAEEIKSEIYKLGKELIVFNGHGKEIEEQIKSVNNVIKVLSVSNDKIELPKISVVTVSYNQAEFIDENIQTVLSQHYPDFEHLIIDGGSSDNTVEVLKKYPHLKWTSEPDRGQTHALNKGFSRASGEIVAWLNSDDYYPEGVFFEVADKLKDKSILIGACQVTGKEGEFKELVPNFARSWFDILKYWVFFSSPAQPSIFFKKEVLEDFKIKDQEYLDENLDFCMDYEFWLRIGSKYPLINHTSKVLSYCRTYDTNKTGRDMDSVYREMSRVYSRYSKSKSQSERSLSFVIPVTGVDQDVANTLDCISKQQLKNYEILIVDYAEDCRLARNNRRAILDYEKSRNFINVRYIRSMDCSYTQAVNQAFEAACAEYICLLLPGASIGDTFSFEVENLFRSDNIGLALTIKNKPEMQSLIKNANTHAQINIESVFSCPWIIPCFVARKIALLEIGGIRELKTDIFLVNSLIMKLLSKGWQINIENQLKIDFASGISVEKKNSSVSELSGYFAARIITSIYEDEDEFARLRAEHGFGITFSPEMVNNSKQITEKLKDQIKL